MSRKLTLATLILLAATAFAGERPKPNSQAPGSSTGPTVPQQQRHCSTAWDNHWPVCQNF